MEYRKLIMEFVGSKAMAKALDSGIKPIVINDSFVKSYRSYRIEKVDGTAMVNMPYFGEVSPFIQGKKKKTKKK